MRQQIVDERDGSPRLCSQRGYGRALEPGVDHERVGESRVSEPAHPRLAARFGRVGEDDDAHAPGEIGDRFARAGGDVNGFDIGAEEFIEELAALRHIEVLSVSGAIDVLKNRELGDAHLQPAPANEGLKCAHEHGQNLVNVDHQQRAARIDDEWANLARQRVSGEDGSDKS